VIDLGEETALVQVMTGAQAIAQILKMEEIDHVFCVPGESYLELMDAIYDEPGIRLVSARHEGGASFMAEAYGKATGKPGVAMATRAVGAANLSIGIHTASQDSTPMVVFLGQVDSKFRGREGFQEADLDQWFRHLCKWTVEIRDVKRVPELVQRAFRIAKSGRPGPVVVSLPADILSQTAEMSFSPVSVRAAPRPSAAEICDMLQILSTAKRPLFLAGGGVMASNGQGFFQKLAERWKIPIIASFRRHNVISNDHPLFVGHLGLATFPGIVETFRQADTIIAIGTRFSEVTTQGYKIVSPEQTIIHIDIEPSVIGQVYSPHLGIVADAREALTDLLGADSSMIKPEKWSDWAQERRKAYEAAVKIDRSPSGSSVDVKQIMAVLQDELPDDVIITTDAGNFSAWLHSYYQFTGKRTYIGPISGAMGYGLPAAIAAKLAHPDRLAVCIAGDGGFMMTVQELATAVHYKTPVLVILFNNNMYGTIRMHQEKHHPYRVIGTDLTNPDFMTLAESFGIFHARASSDEQFAPCLRQAMQAVREGRSALIEVQCDPERISVMSTISEIRAKSANSKSND
jgi:acetolactate synthase-1/2/3 large subunit